MLDEQIPTTDAATSVTQAIGQPAKTVTVLVFVVGEPPEVREIDPTLEAMQKLVGGYIQVVPIGGRLQVICYEEAKDMGLPPNRYLFGGRDVLCGTFFVTRVDDEGESASMNESDIAMAALYFAGMQVFGEVP